MAEVRYSGCSYHCDLSESGSGRIIVRRVNRHGIQKGRFVEDEAAAHEWLGDHGLRRSKIKRLLREVFPKP